MIKRIKLFNLITLFLVCFLFSGWVNSAPASNTQLRLQTGLSKREGETAFSYLITWKKDDTSIRQVNGLMFVNGTASKKITSADEVAYKITKAINAAVVYQSPHDRGAVAKNNKSEVLVSNKQGFDLTQITVRDYSNQQLKYSIPEKSFKAASAEISIDIVYSAAVEYIAGFSTGVVKEAAGGFVTVTIDSNKPIKIKTNGKSTSEIERELADVLGSKASFSLLPIYPNFVQIRSKNYKSFDGGEVQLNALNARSIVIDVNDSGLGVLTKFKFIETGKVKSTANKTPYFIILILLGIVAVWFFKKKNKSISV